MRCVVVCDLRINFSLANQKPCIICLVVIHLLLYVIALCVDVTCTHANMDEKSIRLFPLHVLDAWRCLRRFDSTLSQSNFDSDNTHHILIYLKRFWCWYFDEMRWNRGGHMATTSKQTHRFAELSKFTENKKVSFKTGSSLPLNTARERRSAGELNSQGAA